MSESEQEEGTYVDREDFYEQANNRILAIYPQQTFHHNAYIVGGRKGLTELRDAINQALEGDHIMGLGVGLAMAHPSDQETFTTVVVHDQDCDQAEDNDRTFKVTLDDMPCPYYDSRAQESYREGAVRLIPNERHIMAAGVAHHLLNERLKAEDAAAEAKRAAAAAEPEAHPS